MRVIQVKSSQPMQRQNSTIDPSKSQDEANVQDHQQAPLSALQAYSKINFKSSHNVDTPKTVIILLGAPNSGKGTFSNKISKQYGVPQISTGDILKKEVRGETDLGLEAKSYIAKGKLVPDRLILDIFKQRILEPDCKNGFILDGFPRTEAQAAKLKEMLEEMPNIKLKVLNLDVPEEVLYERSANRLICSDCSKSYNRREYKEEKCDEADCKGTLIHRNDDTPEVLASRLEEYHEKTQPVADFYAKDGKLKNIQIDAAVGKDCNLQEIMNQLVDEIDN